MIPLARRRCATQYMHYKYYVLQYTQAQHSCCGATLDIPGLAVWPGILSALPDGFMTCKRSLPAWTSAVGRGEARPLAGEPEGELRWSVLKPEAVSVTSHLEKIRTRG